MAGFRAHSCTFVSADSVGTTVNYQHCLFELCRKRYRERVLQSRSSRYYLMLPVQCPHEMGLSVGLPASFELPCAHTWVSIVQPNILSMI